MRWFRKDPVSYLIKAGQIVACVVKVSTDVRVRRPTADDPSEFETVYAWEAQLPFVIAGHEESGWAPLLQHADRDYVERWVVEAVLGNNDLEVKTTDRRLELWEYVVPLSTAFALEKQDSERFKRQRDAARAALVQILNSTMLSSLLDPTAQLDRVRELVRNALEES